MKGVDFLAVDATRLGFRLRNPAAAARIPNTMLKERGATEGRGFNPAVSRLLPVGVSAPEARRRLFQHPANRHSGD